MHITKTRVEHWLRSYSRFAFACCLWCPLSAFVLVFGLLLSSRNSAVAKVTTGLIGTAVGLLFVAMGVYFILTGLSLFYRRLRTTRLGAVLGLCAGLLFGGFCAYLGIVGFLMMLR